MNERTTERLEVISVKIEAQYIYTQGAKIDATISLCSDQGQEPQRILKLELRHEE